MCNFKDINKTIKYLWVAIHQFKSQTKFRKRIFRDVFSFLEHQVQEKELSARKLWRNMVSNSFLVETSFVTKQNPEASREKKLKLFKKQENWFLQKQW